MGTQIKPLTTCLKNMGSPKIGEKWLFFPHYCLSCHVTYFGESTTEYEKCPKCGKVDRVVSPALKKRLQEGSDV